MPNFCVNCGKEISNRGAQRCHSCAQKDGRNSRYIDGHCLDTHYCIDCGKEIRFWAKRCKHCAAKDRWKNPTEKMQKQFQEFQKASIELFPTLNQIENGRKLGLKYGAKNIKKAQETLREGVWISGPENRFYEEYLEPIFYDQDLRRQYYIKGLNHAFDFALPDFKILIEVDGNYYHNLPDRKERDAEVSEFIWRTYPDWKIYRYNDDDMRKLGII